jgi:cytochrome c-type biogenesis protein CcsB
MPVNSGLADISNDFLLTAVVIYALAMLAYACDFAYGKKKLPALRAAKASTAVAKASTAVAAEPAPDEVALVGAKSTATAGGIPSTVGTPSAVGTPPTGGGAGAASGDSPSGDAAGSGLRGAIKGVPDRESVGRWVTIAVVLTSLGLAAHLSGVVLRGLSVHRLPWGDMYEFVTALTCVAVAFFLGVMIRYRAYYLGLFVMAAVVLVLGLAETVIYTPAGPLVPALQSYWLAIHVTAMTLATGVFFVAAVIGIAYLFVDRHARRVAAGRPTGSDGILRRLPRPEVLDRLAYRTVVFGFPIWTFGVMAGAIWADRAWGSYWSWDPTETWAFITWVVYACFLHARATAGWRGRRAAYIQLAGFACLLFNVLVISLLVPGLHSYAGLT